VRHHHRTDTEVRGDDEDLWDQDWPTGSTPPHFPKAHGRMPTEKELRERPFVSKPISPRCWCGRPIKDSTNRCLKEHLPYPL
jgi:hypothetical protein